MHLLYLNVYLVSRAYSGPQEGGIWHDIGEAVASVPIVAELRLGHEHSCAQCNDARDGIEIAPGQPTKFCPDIPEDHDENVNEEVARALHERKVDAGWLKKIADGVNVPEHIQACYADGRQYDRYHGLSEEEIYESVEEGYIANYPTVTHLVPILGPAVRVNKGWNRETKDYDYEFVDSIDSKKEELASLFADQQIRTRSSCAGGQDVVVCLEDHFAVNYNTYQPFS